FFFQAEDGIRDRNVTGVQTCALPICPRANRIGACRLAETYSAKAVSAHLSHVGDVKDATTILCVPLAWQSYKDAGSNPATGTKQGDRHETRKTYRRTPRDRSRTWS